MTTYSDIAKETLRSLKLDVMADDYDTIREIYTETDENQRFHKTGMEAERIRELLMTVETMAAIIDLHRRVHRYV